MFSQWLHFYHGKTVFVSITTVQSLMCVNNRVHYGLMVVNVCLQMTSHFHHYADLEEHEYFIVLSSSNRLGLEQWYAFYVLYSSGSTGN